MLTYQKYSIIDVTKLRSTLQTNKIAITENLHKGEGRPRCTEQRDAHKFVEKRSTPRTEHCTETARLLN